jgi:hypothetical protein
VLVGGFALFRLFTGGGDEPVTPVVNDPVETAAPGTETDPAEPATDPQPTDPPVTNTGTNPPPEPPPQGGQEPAQEGGQSLESFINDQVADFTLQQVAEAPDFIADGANAALQVLYSDQSGGVLEHYLTGWSSEQAAADYASVFANTLIEARGAQVVEQGPVTDQAGTQIGTFYLLTDGNLNFLVWNNGTLVPLIAATAADDSAQRFYASLTY